MPCSEPIKLGTKRQKFSEQHDVVARGNDTQIFEASS